MEYEVEPKSKRKIFVSRDNIVDDLISSYLEVGTSQSEVELLFGTTHFEDSKLTYPLTTYFFLGTNGLEKGRDLVIALDTNQKVVKTYINSWSH